MPNTNLALENRAHALGQRFVQRFGGSPRTYQAPGRVNLIGDHTDYNDGFVMPAAIGFYTRASVAPRHDRKLVIHSENYSEQVEFDLDHLPATGAGHWSDYVIGVVKMLERSGKKLGGANLLVDGDVPQGAGLSSSASIEVAVGYALLDLADQAIDRTEIGQTKIDRTKLASLCQQAENEFVGARCGVMDQFVASHGKRGQALLLDCRSLEYRLLPLPDDAALAICNTMVKHSIAKGEYNQRRAECEAGVRGLSKYLPNVRALRDVTPEDLEAYGHELPDIVMRRCRHVIGENARVLQAAGALELGDLQAFGNLMRQSHRSLRDDFEVSCSELDLMVELAEQAEGVYGARMTGGGFGGCTIALVQAGCVEAFKRTIQEGYERSAGCKPEIYLCSAADGVGQVVA
ncbi:MAG TPA: galactokinase [Terriglobales bacterium]|nr:galactokinase [Terriglobales bacterium]